MAARQRQRKTRKPDNMCFRAASPALDSIDEEARSVRAAISTENPVLEFDWDRMDYVPRVLLARGAEFPSNGQVPLMDSHYPRDVASQLGSIRGLSKEDSTVDGTLVFSAASEDAWTKVREGHVTDVSVGFRINPSGTIHIKEGKSRKIRGREFTGPMNVETRWRVLEGSITPIGADEQAKLRGADPANVPPFPRSNAMDEELRQQLIEAGLPEDATDDEAREFLAERLKKEEERQDPPPADPPKLFDPEEIKRAAEDAADKALDRREQERAEFRTSVEQVCELADMPQLVDHCVSTFRSLDDARTYVLEQKRTAQPDIGGSFRAVPGGAQRDKHVGALKDAVNLRAYKNAGFKDANERMPEKDRAPGWRDFQYASLLDIARECLHADGLNTRGLTAQQVAVAALGFPGDAGLRADPAYHVTGSFPNLTLDALNKTLRAGYTERPMSWQTCFRQAESVPDFKDIHRISLGAVPNLPIWPDNDAMNQASFDDEKITYAVEARATEVSFSWRLVVNDDMSALGRTPSMMGRAAARTVNANAWAVITANAALATDSVALFAAATGNRKRTNLTTGSGAPSVATVQTLTNLMRQMRGINTPEAEESDDILNLQPAYIVGPGALETTINQLVMSAYDLSKSNSITYNTTQTLQPVIEPLLDANSTTAWYLFADPGQIDTVEVTFLQGQETPATNSYMDQKTWSQNYQIVQTFEAQAIDHRGMQKHAGA